MGRGLTRTMVVWVPDWPVTAAAVAADRSPDEPIAILEKGKVLATSAAARAGGVRRGLRARDAQSRCPELVVLKYDPVIDARAFDPVIGCLEALIPGIQVIRPGMCALKARGPTRFYGSESAAAEKLLDRLETFDVPGGRVGIADGPFAAEQAARSSPAQTRILVVPPGESAEFLAPFSVDTLEQPTLADLLRRLGLRSLGAFARLSPTEVLTRFGPDGAFAHRLACGYDERPVVGREVPPELVRTLDFEPAVDRVDQVAFAVRSVADELIARLTELGLVCTTLRIEAGTESGRIHEREWLHPRWFTAADVVDRVRWQLQGSGTATSELTSSVVRLRIVPEQVDPVGAHVDGLWGGGPDERIHRALSRVQSMLGHGAVTSVVLGGGRSPAERQTLIPWGDRPTPSHPPTHPWPGSQTPTTSSHPPPHLLPFSTTPTHPQPHPPTPTQPNSLSPPDHPWPGSLTPTAPSPPHPQPHPTTPTPPNSLSPAHPPDHPWAGSLTPTAPSPPHPLPPSTTPPNSLSPAHPPDHPWAGSLTPTAPPPPHLLPPSTTPTQPQPHPTPSTQPWSGSANSARAGRWPTLAPTTIFPTPLPAEVVDEDGAEVSVSARGALSGTPTAFRLAPDPRVADSNKLHPITAWAGPWLVDERWWDPNTESRRARFQFTTADTRAWLFTLHQTTWQAEATYD